MHREQRLDGLDFEHHSTFDDEVGLIRVLDPAPLVDEGQRGPPFEPYPSQFHLVSQALLVRRLQEPRPEVTMHFDARADDLVGVPSKTFPAVHAGFIARSSYTFPLLASCSRRLPLQPPDLSTSLPLPGSSRTLYAAAAISSPIEASTLSKDLGLH